MKLILVESPTKARTLSRFLGKKYRIEATFGHLRDLPKSELGVDLEHAFAPKYIIPKDKTKRVNELRKLVKGDDPVILATDPDREGEAISYHMAVILSSKTNKIASEHIDTDRFSRITFHEITEEAINEALAHPGKINMPLVNAQQARRVLDRLVGYKLSPLLWKKLSRRWLSAGRVQSVAVRLIVEREREIQKFGKEEFWVIEADFKTVQGKDFLAALVAKSGVKYEVSKTIQLFDGTYTFTKTTINSKELVDGLIAQLQNAESQPFTISAVDKKEVKRNPAPPYTTSAMQIDAGRKLGYTSKRIMQIAQNLYEEGLITYHRTDSFNLSTKFLGAAKSYIESTYGPQYSQYRTYTTKSKMAQEAHEAIRPTDIAVRASDIQGKKMEMRTEHERLYDLIWKRAVASQAAAAVFDSTTIKIKSGSGYEFQTQGSIIKFDGFLKITGHDSETIELPPVTVGEQLTLKKATPTQKYTSPPPRYSEASLIKALEEDGIGRPSTYAPTISTIQERLYVAKEQKEDGRKGRNFVPTELGFLVSDFLVAHFPNIVDLQFTANMEKTLDEVAEGTREWTPVMAEFWTPFNEKLNEVEQTVVKLEAPVERTGNKCPECKVGDEIIKQGRFGKFLACSRFPECKYTKNLVEKLDVKCPTCKEGDVVVKKTKRGRIFYGCSRYPACHYASWTNPTAPVKDNSKNSGDMNASSEARQ